MPMNPLKVKNECEFKLFKGKCVDCPRKIARYCPNRDKSQYRAQAISKSRQIVKEMKADRDKWVRISHDDIICCRNKTHKLPGGKSSTSYYCALAKGIGKENQKGRLYEYKHECESIMWVRRII
jgi:hypothetical protein